MTIVRHSFDTIHQHRNEGLRPAPAGKAPGLSFHKFKTNQIWIFLFLIAELPPTEGSARRAIGVQFLKSGCSIHWFLKYEKVLRASARSYGVLRSWLVFQFRSVFPSSNPVSSPPHFLMLSAAKLRGNQSLLMQDFLIYHRLVFLKRDFLRWKRVFSFYLQAVSSFSGRLFPFPFDWQSPCPCIFFTVFANAYNL